MGTEGVGAVTTKSLEPLKTCPVGEPPGIVTVSALFTKGVRVPRRSLEPGDLVFFHDASHVGIYIGHGRFIHAPHTGDVVRIASLSNHWYRTGYTGAVRIS